MTAGAEERTCESCHQPIQRNLAQLDGFDYHYGCLKGTVQFGRAVAICQGCFSWLTDAKIVELNFQEGQVRRQRTCGVCGGQELRFRPVPARANSTGTSI